MELVISRVFSDQSIPLREDLLNEVLTDLHESIKEISPFINGREAKFQYWVSQQLSFGLQKSQVHIINLRKFAEEVRT